MVTKKAKIQLSQELEENLQQIDTLLVKSFSYIILKLGNCIIKEKEPFGGYLLDNGESASFTKIKIIVKPPESQILIDIDYFDPYNNGHDISWENMNELQKICVLQAIQHHFEE